ncbi:MAG: zf-HC2 domain-containing protein [Burkholderiales bacterium]
MPPRDDQSRFEQVLARHLRRGADCPDAETLAAYHERALTAEEMNAFKGHIAACGRCQEVLAGLEASEGVTVHEQDELYVADIGSARAAEVMSAAAPMSAAPAIRRTRPNRTWKWMAPAAAVAAGILVWVGVRQMRHTSPETTTVAVNAPPRAADEAGSQAPALKEQGSPQFQDQRVRTAERLPQVAAPAALPPPIQAEPAKRQTN